MRRKISKAGPASLIVSLPSKWVKKNNVKSGDEIEVEENGPKLTLSYSNGKEELKSKKVKIYGSDLIVRRFIASAYRQGYNELILEFDDPNLLNKIEEYMVYFMGFEIVEQGKNYCKVKNLMDTNTASFEVSLRRIFLIIISMSEEILASIKEKKFSSLKTFSLSETTVNKLAEFCKRNLVVYDEDSVKSKFYYSMIWEMEKICDEYYGICNELNNCDVKVDSKLIVLFQNVNNYVKKYYDLYYTFNIHDTADVYKNKELIIKDAKSILKSKLKYQEELVCFHLMKITEMTYNSTSMVFALYL